MKTALVAMWLAGAVVSSQKLTEKSGVVWTIRTEAGPSTSGEFTSSWHHLLRNGQEVAKVDSGQSFQQNPSMGSSTLWTFKIEEGALKATQERADIRTDPSGHTRSTMTVTSFTWNGKALVPGTPTTTAEP